MIRHRAQRNHTLTLSDAERHEFSHIATKQPYDKSAIEEIFKVEWTDESTYAFCFANTWKGEQNLPHEMIPAAFVVIS